MFRINTLRPFIGMVAGILLAQWAQESAHAANYNIFSGQSIQTKINSATNGDTITIYAGLYSENLTISGKDVRLLRPASQSVSLSGNITFSGITTPYTFSGFTIGGMTDKTLTIENCPKMSVYAVTMPAGNVSVTGSNTSADFVRCTITGNVTVGSSVQRFSFTRSTVTETLDTSASNSLVAYSNLRWFRQRSSGQTYLLGNTINERSENGGNTIEVRDTSTLAALNNVIRDGGYGSYSYSGDNHAFFVTSGATLSSLNNIIYNYSGYRADRGFLFEVNRSTVSQISSNIGFSIQDEFLYGPFNYINAFNNLSGTGSGGGVYLASHLTADPVFVDTTDFVLGPTSPARNAGDPDPRFNDIDGTRNDMGIYGGPFYDPEGRTGSKPVVLKAELDNTQFVRGELSTVKLKATGAATGSP
jgi:hypothetical protein